MDATRNACNNQDHTCKNQDLQKYQGHPKAVSDLEISGQERKNRNLEIDNNAKSCTGTTKCHKIGKS